MSTEIRYEGPDEARDLAIRGGFITFPRMVYVDVEKAAEAGGLEVEHALIVARSVVKQPDWSLRSAQKAAKTRKQNTDAATPLNEQET